jgi:hypothetical protein
MSLAGRSRRGRRARVALLVGMIGCVVASIVVSTAGRGRPADPRSSSGDVVPAAGAGLLASRGTPPLPGAGSDQSEVTASTVAVRRVRGVVLDGSERPIEGARIEAQVPPVDVMGGQSEVVGTASTDERGRFEIALPARDAVRLQASAAGFATEETDVDPQGEDVRVRLWREARRMVRVMFAGASPPPDGSRFVVQFLPDEGQDAQRFIGSGWSREIEVVDGRLHLSDEPETLPEGLHSVHVRGPMGFGRAQIRILADATQVDVALTLDPGGAIAGLVDDDQGRPLADAAIVVRRPADGDEWVFSPHAITDAFGRFRVSGLETGAHSVEAEHEGRRATTIARTGERDVVVRFERLAQRDVVIEGRPWDRKRMEFWRRPVVLGEEQWRRSSDWEGLTLKDVPGEYEVWVTDGPMQGPRVRVLLSLDAGATPVVVQAPPRPSIVSGVVHDETGAPVAFAYLVASGGTGMDRWFSDARSARDGSFEVRVPPDEPCRVVAYFFGHRGQGSVDGVTPAAGPVVIRLVPHAQIRGTVAASGPFLPVRGSVSAWLVGDDAAGTNDNDAPTPDGRFVIDAVGPGIYRIAARVGGLVGTAPFDVTVTAGETRRGVSISLAPGGRIEGTVRDADGGIVEAAIVEFKHPFKLQPAPAVSDASGRFEAEGLLPGTWTLRARRLGATSSVVSVVRIDANETVDVALRVP